MTTGRWLTADRRLSRAVIGTLLVLALAAALFVARRTPVDPGLTVTVRRGALAARLTATGTLRPTESFTYHSPVPGRDVEVLDLAPEGSRVKTGDLLVRLDASGVQRELVQARDDLRQAQIDLDVAGGEWEEAQAQVTSVSDGEGAVSLAEVRSRLQLAERRAERLQQEYEALKPLLARGFITREELGRSAGEYEQAEEELALARKRAEVVETLSHPREQKRAALTLAQKDSQRLRARARVQETGQRLAELGAILDSCTIYARGPGMVVYEEYLNANPRRKLRLGDHVTSSQGLVTIPEVERMLVDASVSEAEVHRVHQGQRASVHVEAFPGVAISGVVTRVGTVAARSPYQPQQGKRFALEIALDPAPVDLRPEMSARADIEIGDRGSVLLLPVNAVFDEQGGLVAHRVGPSGVETRPLVLGETDDRLVEVVNGLNEGDAVLLSSPVTTPTPGTERPAADLKGAGPLGPH